MRPVVGGKPCGGSRSRDFEFRISNFEFTDIPRSSRSVAGQRTTGRDVWFPRPQAARNSKLKTKNSKLNTDLPGWIVIPNSHRFLSR